MAFANDLFTDTNGTALESHTASSGATWTKHGSSATGATINSNKVAGDADATLALYYLSEVPATADYDVSADVTITDGTLDLSGVAGRISTSALTLYFARHVGALNEFQLVKTVAGTTTTLGTWSVTVSNGTTVNMRLSMYGTQIRAYWNDVERISVTDSAISAAGRAGLRIGNTSAKDSIDNLVATAYTTVTVDDSNVVAGLTPYNWYRNGSTSAVSQHTPAGIEFSFTGIYCAVVVDVADLVASGLTAAEWPRLRYSVDNAAWTEVQLASTTTRIVVATAVADATHTVDLWLYATNSAGENWTTPQNALKITGIIVDGGEALAARTLPSDSVLIFGDSITRGKGFRTSVAPTGEGNEAWSMVVARALDCRPGIVGISGQGWTVVGSGGEPDFEDSWDFYSSGKSRLTGGVFTPTPAYIFICHGANDNAASDASVQTAVEATIPGIRTAAPSVPIFVLIPFGLFKKTAILAGLVTAGGTAITRTVGTSTLYRYATDHNLYAIDIGTTASLGLTTYPGSTATQQAYDGLHPGEYAVPALAARIAAMVKVALTGGPSMSRVLTGM